MRAAWTCNDSRLHLSNDYIYKTINHKHAHVFKFVFMLMLHLPTILICYQNPLPHISVPTCLLILELERLWMLSADHSVSYWKDLITPSVGLNNKVVKPGVWYFRSGKFHHALSVCRAPVRRRQSFLPINHRQFSQWSDVSRHSFALQGMASFLKRKTAHFNQASVMERNWDNKTPWKSCLFSSVYQ